MIDEKRIENAVKEIIIAIGEDANREGLKETPKRVANMYAEIFSGIDDNPKEYLKIFNEKDRANEIVVVKDIPFNSVCEHHMLPFVGCVNIAYMPKDDEIIGLSKLIRIVNCFSRRLQIQERLTSQIADFLFNNLKSDGVAVIIKAEHLCMTMRGVKSYGAKTYTQALKGIFKTNFEKRMEVTKLLTNE